MKTKSLLSLAAAQRAGLAIGLIALVAAAWPARANLMIVPNYLPSITNDSNVATIENTIDSAIADYAALISDPITVNIDFQEGGGLGSSSTAITQVSYTTYRALLVLHATSSNDSTALASLPVQSNSPVDGNANMWLTTANARALGFSELASPDSTITLNTSIMNLDRTGPQDASKYDLKSVVEHEIDEALGLGSGLNLPSDFPRLSRPQDLFRYSSPGVRSYDTSSTVTSYLSIDGGVTSLIGFNQNGAADYGDWASTGITHVQDAFGTPGSQPDLNVELTNLDVIGYTLTPEPSSAILAAGLAVAALRRGRRLR
jgi:hypothetical protein